MASDNEKGNVNICSTEDQWREKVVIRCSNYKICKSMCTIQVGNLFPSRHLKPHKLSAYSKHKPLLATCVTSLAAGAMIGNYFGGE